MEKYVDYENNLQSYVLSPYYGLEISQLHLSRFPSRFPVGISL